MFQGALFTEYNYNIRINTTVDSTEFYCDFLDNNITKTVKKEQYDGDIIKLQKNRKINDVQSQFINDKNQSFSDILKNQLYTIKIKNVNFPIEFSYGVDLKDLFQIQQNNNSNTLYIPILINGNVFYSSSMIDIKIKSRNQQINNSEISVIEYNCKILKEIYDDDKMIKNLIKYVNEKYRTNIKLLNVLKQSVYLPDYLKNIIFKEHVKHFVKFKKQVVLNTIITPEINNRNFYSRLYYADIKIHIYGFDEDFEDVLKRKVFFKFAIVK